MDKDDPVRDDETLYRAVLSGQYTFNGRKIVNSKAFFDRDQQPSVGRAELTECNPTLFLSRSKLDGKSGVISLNAGVVCEIDLEVHTVKVIPAPEEDNPGHAKITMITKLCVSKNKRKTEFDSLREALTDIANENIGKNDWALEPKE